MAYDEELADRVRQAVGPRTDVTEKKMFGGLAFLLSGKMFCGVVEGDLMVRVGPERFDAALEEAHTRLMDFTGRPMKGFVFVGSAGTKTVKSTGAWVEQGLAYAATQIGVPTKRRRSPKAVPPKL